MALRLGGRQRSCHDITFLLVLASEDATGDRKYGLLTIWVSPSQARVPSMEEMVEKLTAWVSSGPNWPYALVWLHKGTCCAPLPKEGHLGILPQRGVEVTYPIGLNRCKELVITSLLEPLANSISLTTGEPVYLEIDILPSLVEELDQKVPPIGEVSTTVIASPHRSTPQNQKERAA